MAPLFVYLAYGPSPAAARELRFSLETLQAELWQAELWQAELRRDAAAPPSPLVGEGGGAGLSLREARRDSRIVLYTDRPEAYADLGATVIDASALLRDAGAYRHRIKPMGLADALRRFGRPIAMLDLDSFIKPGFADSVARALQTGAAMNFLVRRDPYPDFPPFETNLPHLGRYRFDPGQALMLNSGLVVVSPKHLPLIEDAVVLIERFWTAGLRRHDLEQFAVAEVLRLGGVKIALIDDVFVHYCARWSRRYMRRQLRRRAPGEPVAFSKARVRVFKAYWTLRLAMRKARRFRKTRAGWPTI